jgi:ABC-type multidrug transport system fused ATPase/permease subunit
MDIIGLYVALGVYIGSTLTIILCFREAGNKLEIRANEVSRTKKPLVSSKYLETIEKTIQRFTYTRTLSPELEEEFERLDNVRYELNHFMYDLEDSVDRMTKSVFFGIGSVFSILVLSYVLSLPNDSYSVWIGLVVTFLVGVSFYRYISDGIGQITSLRKMEKLVNAIERCDTFDRLAKTFEELE